MQEESGTVVHFVYNAGPCGFALIRRICDGTRLLVCSADFDTQALRSGDRVKTDCRVAREMVKCTSWASLSTSSSRHAIEIDARAGARSHGFYGVNAEPAPPHRLFASSTQTTFAAEDEVDDGVSPMDPEAEIRAHGLSLSLYILMEWMASL